VDSDDGHQGTAAGAGRTETDAATSAAPEEVKMSRLTKPLAWMRDRLPVRFGYDAVDDTSKRRRTPRVTVMSEDQQLTESKRRSLIATTRDVRRNYAIAAWMIRKHLDYVSTFSFQARTEDEAFNRRLEELMEWRARRQNFDVALRHGRRRFIRLAEACRTIDGDFFVLKLSSGKVQGIEGDRIRTPTLGGLPEGVDADKLTHGVQLAPGGAARAYCLCDRAKYGSGFQFKRMVPARHLVQHGYLIGWTRFVGFRPWRQRSTHSRTRTRISTMPWRRPR